MAGGAKIRITLSLTFAVHISITNSNSGRLLSGFKVNYRDRCYDRKNATSSPGTPFAMDIVRRFNRGRSAQNSLGLETFKRAGTQFRTTSRVIYLDLTTIKNFLISKQTEAMPDSSGCSSRKEPVRNFRALRLRTVFVAQPDDNPPTFIRHKHMHENSRKKKNANLRRARLRSRSV